MAEQHALSVESVVRVMVVVGERVGFRRSGVGDRQGGEALEVAGSGLGMGAPPQRSGDQARQAAEDEVPDRLADRRRLIRQEKAAPLIDELAAVLDAMLPKLPGKSDLATAIRYARTLWTALRRYLDDGRLEIDNNAAERQIRPLALGRKNYLVKRHSELIPWRQ